MAIYDMTESINLLLDQLAVRQNGLKIITHSVNSFVSVQCGKLMSCTGVAVHEWKL
jgi:hypothetical protein